MDSNVRTGSSPVSATKIMVTYISWLDYHPDKMGVGSSSLSVTTIASGSAWRGHLTVTQEKQTGSNPVGTAFKDALTAIILCDINRLVLSKMHLVEEIL